MVEEKDELVRKRVLYIGSAVPLDTADGLEGVQKPLLERYPVDNDDNIEGILSFMSVAPGGISLQYVSDPRSVLFFPITSLSLCAAVRCVSAVNAATGEQTARFVSLSSPAAGGANSKRPAIFTTITRRTEGLKVLECHGFVCSSSKDAMELVQCTSYADRLSKGKINGGAVPPAALTPRGDAESLSPRGLETRSVSASVVGAGVEADHPVRLVAGGETVSQRAAPEFYQPPPEHGYFYKTRDSQVKTYAVERVVEGEAERLRAISPYAATTLSRGPRSVHGGGGGVVQGVGPGAMTLPYPPGRTLIPVRALPPPTSYSAAATLGRPPRFFSPPPPMVRMRPGGPMMARGGEPLVLLPPQPHPALLDAPYLLPAPPGRLRRAGSESSSHGSSGSLSPPASPRARPATAAATAKPAVNGEREEGGAGGEGEGGEGEGGGDGSSDVSSRPRSPPTDYEKGGPRSSRKDKFNRSQRSLREVNGGVPGPVYSYATLPGVPPAAMPLHPYDLYMYPRYPYPAYPAYVMERARSVPPPAARSKSKDGKKSGRKAKKEKKKKSGKSRANGVPSDISTDSVGYASEVGPGAGEYPRMPRDFRRFENQFKHERAFSKSLAQESRVEQGDTAGNAYSLNEQMVSRPNGQAEFNLY